MLEILEGPWALESWEILPSIAATMQVKQKARSFA